VKVIIEIVSRAGIDGRRVLSPDRVRALVEDLEAGPKRRGQLTGHHKAGLAEIAPSPLPD
jgi:hypothetical protein